MVASGLQTMSPLPFAATLLDDDHPASSEDEIAEGIRHAARERERNRRKGAGAVGIAAILVRQGRNITGPTALIISGGNIDPKLCYKKIVDGDRRPKSRTSRILTENDLRAIVKLDVVCHRLRRTGLCGACHQSRSYAANPAPRHSGVSG